MHNKVCEIYVIFISEKVHDRINAHFHKPYISLFAAPGARGPRGRGSNRRIRFRPLHLHRELSPLRQGALCPCGRRDRRRLYPHSRASAGPRIQRPLEGKGVRLRRPENRRRHERGQLHRRPSRGIFRIHRGPRRGVLRRRGRNMDPRHRQLLQLRHQPLHRPRLLLPRRGRRGQRAAP